MREGNPSPRFGERGLNFIHFGDRSNPLLAKLYSEDDEVISTLSEMSGNEIPEDFEHRYLRDDAAIFPTARYLVEKLPCGKVLILHDDPVMLVNNKTQFSHFLDRWISRHESGLHGDPYKVVPSRL